MRLVTMIVGAGMIAAAATAAYADSLTSRVLEWNPVKKTITFADRSEMIVDPKIVPQELRAGDEVTIDFKSDDNGVTAVYSVTISKPAQQTQ